MRKIIFIWVFLISLASLFSQVPLMKIYMNDGSTKEYNIKEIVNLSILASTNPMNLVFVFRNLSQQRIDIKNIVKIDISYNNGIPEKLLITTKDGTEDILISDIEQINSEPKIIWVIKFAEYGYDSEEKMDNFIQWMKDNCYDEVAISARQDDQWQGNFDIGSLQSQVPNGVLWYGKHYSKYHDNKSEWQSPRNTFWQYNPFDEFIKKAAANNIKVWAWFPICLDWYSINQDGHEDWVQRAASTINDNEKKSAKICPSNSEVKDFINNLFQDFLNRYDKEIKGVIIDHIRYSEDFNFCHCNSCKTGYKEMFGQEPLDFPFENLKNFSEFKISQINQIVKSLADLAHNHNKKIGAFLLKPDKVDNGERTGDQKRGQDPKSLIDDCLDFIAPMLYFGDGDLTATGAVSLFEIDNSRVNINHLMPIVPGRPDQRYPISAHQEFHNGLKDEAVPGYFFYVHSYIDGQEQYMKDIANTYNYICNKDEIKPTITSISPDSASIGDTITIAGSNFGSVQDTSYVSFNGVKAKDYPGWNDTQIKVKVPSGATTGKVTVTVNGRTSDGVDFTIKTGGSDSFETVTIGTQVWMKKNLDVDHYRDGTSILQVTDPTQWANDTIGAWCYYNNSDSLGKIYGKLYNWYAVNNPHGLAPTGWHVPTDAEWATITILLGGDYVAGGKLKEVGTSHWQTPNTGATNNSGFTALPGGIRYYDGRFESIEWYGAWWSSTPYTIAGAWGMSLTYDAASIVRGSGWNHESWSVRCIKDNNSSNPQISYITPDSASIGDAISIFGSGFGNSRNTSFVSFDTTKATEYPSWCDTAIKVKVPTGAISGKVTVIVNGQTSDGVDFTIKTGGSDNFETVTIGTQVWMKKNLDVDHYRNDDPIPQVTDPTAWMNLTTGAWCYVNNDPTMEAIYGKLYNWYAVNDSRGLAPTGWHVSSDDEWTTLTNHLSGDSVAGGKLKSIGTIEGGDGLWYAPNTGATNESGFTGLPSGYRHWCSNISSGFEGTMGLFGCWWSTSKTFVDYYNGLYYGLDHNAIGVCRYMNDKGMGYSVRCVKD